LALISLIIVIHACTSSANIHQMSVFQRGEQLAREVRSPDGSVQTLKLLEVCREVLPIVGASPNPCLNRCRLPQHATSIINSQCAAQRS
jgi:hypothetical protein